MPKAASYPSPALKWQPLRSIVRNRRPTMAMQDWLTDSGSLTARLIVKSGGEFRVEVIRQMIGMPELNEREALQTKRPALALIREVILFGHDEPWVFARSLLPLATLTGTLRHLRKQNTRPLGAFLFSQPQLTRSTIAIAKISRDHAYVPRDLFADEALWGRRSVFHLRQKSLLVSEVFLPAFVARFDR